MMYIIYNILYSLVLLFMLPLEYIRRPQQLRSRWLKERLGFPAASSNTNGSIWVHAVSVGEVIASIRLIKSLKESYPDKEIVLSTVTDTGQKVARERAGDMATIIYIPFDMTFAVANAFARIRPALLIIMETELWPVIIHFFKKHGVPVLLMNGRLSEKSAKGYLKLRFFFDQVVKDISFFCMQDEVYAERIISLGAAKENVRATGNFKFDTKPSAPIPAWTRMLTGPVLIAGSTHRPEEDIVLDFFVQLIPDYPTLSLILAPRHPERFGEVEDLIRKKGIGYIKRSELHCGAETKKPESVKGGLVVILDVMGELSSVYGAADIAIIGGSFIEHGGQNPLEPAFWGKAIVCGPHMENFPFIDEFYRKGAAVMTSKDNLCGTVKGILASPERFASMGKAAKELYDKDAGATDRAIGMIKRYL
jgi:3-deoxy-D-manno-octulosonic-acid transferase